MPGRRSAGGCPRCGGEIASERSPSAEVLPHESASDARVRENSPSDGEADPAGVAIGSLDLKTLEVASSSRRIQDPERATPARPLLEASGRFLGWAVTAALIAVVLLSGLWQEMESIPTGDSEFARFGVLEVQSLEGKWIDGPAGDALLLVTAVFRNDSAEVASLGSIVEVALLDSGGAPLHRSRPLGLSTAPSEASKFPLKDLDPVAAARQLAAHFVEPGKSVVARALFRNPPISASRFELEQSDPGATLPPGPLGQTAPD